MFWNNYAHTNPATIGLFQKRAANVLWRNQWTKINGAPTTLWVNYAERLDKFHSAVGIAYEYDVIGFNRQHTTLFNYAYHVKMGESVVSFGISAGTVTSQIDPDWISPSTLNDPALPTESRDTKFQSDFGIVFHRQKWNMGASITQWNRAKVFYANDASYQYATHFWLFGDYTFQPVEQLQLKPQVQVCSDGVKTTFSANVLATFRENYWFGVNSMNFTNISLGVCGGMDIRNKYRVGYGISKSFIESGDLDFGWTHEIVLSYLIK